VRGYKLTDTVRFGEVSSGVQFIYKHEQDVANVFVAPYNAGQVPLNRDDTIAVVTHAVDLVRLPLQHAAEQNQMQALAIYADRSDVLQAGGHAIQFHWLIAGVQRKSESGVLLYYAAYAIPYGLVRIRAEVPWIDIRTGWTRTMTGGNLSQLGPAYTRSSEFGNELVGAMVSPAPSGAFAASAAGGATPVKLSTPAGCSAMPAVTDTVTYRVYATLEAPLRTTPLPAGYLDLVLDALRHSFVVPTPLSPSVYAPMMAAGNSVMTPAVYGEVAFTLDDQGKVSDVRPTQSSLSPALDQSLYDAPRRADSLQAFPGQVGVDHPGPIRFFVALSPYQPKSGHYVAFFAVRMPAWHPGSRPAISPGDLQPSFAGAQMPAAGDSVLIQFVVDEHGLPVNTTVRLLGATHIEYAKTIVDAALHSQYVPALAAGCPVKGLLERSWRMAGVAP
jgi:hypothetical protein